MLTSKLIGGLLPRFKEPARVKFEHITDFDVLRLEVRKIECEQATSDPVKENKKAQVKMTNADSDDVKGILQQISSRLDKLETKMDNPSSTQPIKTDSSLQISDAVIGIVVKDVAMVTVEASSIPVVHDGTTATKVTIKLSLKIHVGATVAIKLIRQVILQIMGSNSGYQAHKTGDSADYGEPTCHRCGQVGHLAYGCRVDLQKLNLNQQESV